MIRVGAPSAAKKTQHPHSQMFVDDVIQTATIPGHCLIKDREKHRNDQIASTPFHPDILNYANSMRALQNSVKFSLSVASSGNRMAVVSPFAFEFGFLADTSRAP